MKTNKAIEDEVYEIIRSAYSYLYPDTAENEVRCDACGHRFDEDELFETAEGEKLCLDCYMVYLEEQREEYEYYQSKSLFERLGETMKPIEYLTKETAS